MISGALRAFPALQAEIGAALAMPTPPPLRRPMLTLPAGFRQRVGRAERVEQAG